MSAPSWVLVLDKLLKDYVKERYQSASEVLAALKSGEHLDSEK
jgi:hypothetical protein